MILALSVAVSKSLHMVSWSQLNVKKKDVYLPEKNS